MQNNRMKNSFNRKESGQSHECHTQQRNRRRVEKLLAREGQKRFAAMELTARAGLKAANLSFWTRFACTVARQTTERDDKCIHAIALGIGFGMCSIPAFSRSDS
jgi:hypothetical protein